MKYELTDETKTTENGTVLHRICALRDIQKCGVRKGDLGGWIENESNLSQDGDAWIGGNAEVYGDARVCENAEVCGDARVCGDAEVGGNAEVSGYAEVCGDARVCGDAEVGGDAEVYGNAVVSGNAEVYGDARVCENAEVYGDARVSGDAVVYGNACVVGDALVRSSADYAVFKNFWSSDRWFTYTRSNRMWKVGCFYGTGEDLIKKAYADSAKSGRCYEAIVRAVEAIESATAKEGGEK